MKNIIGGLAANNVQIEVDGANPQAFPKNSLELHLTGNSVLVLALKSSATLYNFDFAVDTINGAAFGSAQLFYDELINNSFFFDIATGGGGGNSPYDFTQQRVATAAPYILIPSDCIILANIGNGQANKQCTLPAAPVVGQSYVFKTFSSQPISAEPVSAILTIFRNGNTIDNSPTDLVIDVLHQSITLVYSTLASTWIII